MSRTAGQKEVQDIESGATIVANNNGREMLFSKVVEAPPELRWAFIRKVYAILSVQIVFTAAVAATVDLTPPITHFLLQTTAGIVVFGVSFILPLILLYPLYVYQKRHPVNLALLGLFTVSSAFLVGLACAHIKGRIILETAILTSVLVVSLTLYTFWAVKRGRDFSFLGPFLFGSLLVLITFGLIQLICPLGKLSSMIYGCLGSIVFSGYIIYDTNNLIKRYNYDEYIWASISLYLDVINLFLSLLGASSAADR